MTTKTIPWNVHMASKHVYMTTWHAIWPPTTFVWHWNKWFWAYRHVYKAFQLVFTTSSMSICLARLQYTFVIQFVIQFLNFWINSNNGQRTHFCVTKLWLSPLGSLFCHHSWYIVFVNVCMMSNYVLRHSNMCLCLPNIFFLQYELHISIPQTVIIMTSNILHLTSKIHTDNIWTHLYGTK